MHRSMSSGLFAALSILFVGLFTLPAHAAEKVRAERSPIVRWKTIGIINGPANPLRVPSYFSSPLVQGELVEMTFTINTAATGQVYNTLAEYPFAITSVKVTGSDWAIRMGAPLGSGMVEIANDDPDYGDMLSLAANTPLSPGKTWYQVQIDLRNPGGATRAWDRGSRSRISRFHDFRRRWVCCPTMGSTSVLDATSRGSRLTETSITGKSCRSLPSDPMRIDFLHRAPQPVHAAARECNLG